MVKIIKKIFQIIFAFAFLALFVIIGFFFIGKAEPAKNITWGINFSQMHAEQLGLDWKKSYTEMLDDLKVKKIKLATYWNLLEKEKGKYDFNDLDWQIEEAGKRNADIILAIGMKTPRWPECHIPGWVLSKDEREERVLMLLTELVKRYSEKSNIIAWQVENEPFFRFGECPEFDKGFLKKEIDLVKSTDARKLPVIVSDSGEMSFWNEAAKMGDKVGITMYHKVWFKEINRFIEFPLPAIFYARKSYLINKVFNKDVICVELQAEPWVPNLLYNSTAEEQKETMDINIFKDNIEFAKNTGLDTFYFWGAEWWYFAKEKQNNTEIWNEAKKLF